MGFFHRLGGVAVVVILLASCSSALPDPLPEGQVGSEGFSASAGSFRVSAGAAVAPEGTSVAVEPSASKPGRDLTYLDIISDSIAITLDGGVRQPDAPITIQMDVGGDIDVDRRLGAGDLLVFMSESS